VARPRRPEAPPHCQAARGRLSSGILWPSRLYGRDQGVSLELTHPRGPACRVSTRRNDGTDLAGWPPLWGDLTTSPPASEPLPRALRLRLGECFPLLCAVEARSIKSLHKAMNINATFL
jgi:hypothetical protein